MAIIGTDNYDLIRGDNFTRNYTINLDLTGYTINMQMRTSYTATPIVSLSTTTGEIVINDAASGAFSVNIDDSVTADFDFVTAQYDIEFISPASIVKTYISGEIELIKDYTRV